MSLTWQSNFGSTEYRIFRGKVIAGILKTSTWKFEGHGELDGYMLRFRTSGFWNPTTELLDIEGKQILGTIQYQYMKGAATIIYAGETFQWKYTSWKHNGWAVGNGEDSAEFKTTSFWGSKGQILNENVPGAVVLSAMFVHLYFTRITSIAT